MSRKCLSVYAYDGPGEPLRTLSEVAKMLGMTKQGVRYFEQRAFKKLRVQAEIARLAMECGVIQEAES